jgi:hypothetical protein
MLFIGSKLVKKVLEIIHYLGAVNQNSDPMPLHPTRDVRIVIPIVNLQPQPGDADALAAFKALCYHAIQSH